MIRHNKLLYIWVVLLGVQPMFLLAESSKVSISESKTGKDLDLRNINEQIQSLENLKEHNVARAIRLRNRADRLQFNSEQTSLISAQKYWKEANECDKIADQIQQEINSLKEERDFVENKKPY